MNSYGPASLDDVRRLDVIVRHNFDRTDIIQVTKG